jgi:hypothetical protein
MADIARHVRGSQVTKKTWVMYAFDDVAGNICKALPVAYTPLHSARPR